jgi:hypothetical protein
MSADTVVRVVRFFRSMTETGVRHAKEKQIAEAWLWTMHHRCLALA